MISPRCMVTAIAIALGALGSAGAAEPAKDAEQAERERERGMKSLRLAIEDLTATFGDRYPGGPEYLKRLDAVAEGHGRGSLSELCNEALLANPLLDLEGLLVVLPGKGGDPSNFHGAAHLGRAIAVVSPAKGGQAKVLYEAELTPEQIERSKARGHAAGGSVGFVDLDFDGKKFVFSAAAKHGYQIFEMNVDGTGLRQVSRDEHPHVDNYNPVYLPNGRIVFLSTRMFQGVPCIGGAADVANLFSMNPDGSDVRQLTYEQDHDWEPAVMNDGRVMYTRWEYTDSPHFHTRLVFAMNPDGTNQRALFKSNVYWPNSIFYPRPIPGYASRFVGIITGHHGMTRQGTIYVFDPTLSNEPSRAVVQRIPPDPQELHKSPQWLEESSLDGYRAPCQNYRRPYPLADADGRGAGKYFLVPGGSVVDVFGNSVSLGSGGVEVLPIRARPRPPVIPDRTNRGRKDALVYMSDVYRGGGLAGVPRGTVKKLRIFEYNYGYRKMASHDLIGPDGPWEPHRIWGTVPVEEDGSAYFTVPAMTPLAVQPLDEEGKALQVMRSWFLAQPGENISCVGCHEQPKDVTPAATEGTAFRRPPSRIEPWYGPPRGFSFRREVQPVLDKHCAGCHAGGPTRTGRSRPNLVAGEPIDQARHKKGPPKPEEEAESEKRMAPSISYSALVGYVHRPRAESDYVMFPPGEFDADASPLIQMLRGGHGGVNLDAQSWDRLVTWIDLNGPMFGSWRDMATVPAPGKGEDDYATLRVKMRKLYAGVEDDPESLPAEPVDLGPPVKHGQPAAAPAPDCPGWPFDAVAAAKVQSQAGKQYADGKTSQSIVLVPGETGRDVVLEMVLVPVGEFVMGSNDGRPDEQPPTRVRIERPFWMGRFEVTNQQYALFDPSHDSRYWNPGGKDQGGRGWPMNHPLQPVVRVSWERAVAFCRWLSQETGEKFNLPTEAQWEWACRAGSDKAFFCGDLKLPERGKSPAPGNFVP